MRSVERGFAAALPHPSTARPALTNRAQESAGRSGRYDRLAVLARGRAERVWAARAEGQNRGGLLSRRLERRRSADRSQGLPPPFAWRKKAGRARSKVC